ncbi:MAG: T9SS type A sorting domain-containing protein [Bacteroidia bacterium]|nr:T9SS type A sorting domain-containing protein [Bacteroidia bacterium]
MRNILLTMAFVATSMMCFGQALLEDFEGNRRFFYDFTSGVFVPYTGNPDMMVNSSAVVGSYNRNPAELFDVLVMDADTLFENLADYVSGTKTLSIDVWSPAVGKTVQITLEDSSLAGSTNFPTGRHSVYLATTTVANAWETLTFSFDNRPDATVSDDNVGRMILLFDPNTNNDGQYYFDNLNAPALVTDECAGVSSDSIFNDFNCNQNVNITFNHGQNLRRIPNPDKSGLNTTDYVASYTRNAGEEFDVIVGQFPTAPNFSADSNVITLKVWDANPNTIVRLALQTDDGMNPAVEVVAVNDSTTAGSQWQELAFRYGDLTGQNINAWVLLFDPGNFTADQYFFDEMTLVTSGPLLNNETVLANGSLTVYPNPSQGMTQFAYDLTKTSEVVLSIYDMAGKEVARINEGLKVEGSHSLNWDATNLNNGIYFYQFKAANQVVSGKVVLNK